MNNPQIKPGFTPPPENTHIDENAVMRVNVLIPGRLERLVTDYGFELVEIAPNEAIPGSFWGDDEAGLIGHRLYVRQDTAVHSALHEFAHLLCVDPDRRAQLHTDAHSDDLEEMAVCYLQILLADHLPGFGRERALADMDAWGYSFRLGSAQRWFEEDAADAYAWLQHFGLIDACGQLTFQPRRS